MKAVRRLSALASFLALGLACGPAWAQASPAGPEVQLGAPAARFYGGIEYLLWWLQRAPLPVPLISTGPIETTHHGFVSSPDTTILYGGPHSPAKGGNDTQNFDAFSGSRVTLGTWLDDRQTLAIEARGFFLEQRSAGYSIRSNQDGLPIINIPVFNTVPYTPGGGRAGGLPPNEDGLPASLPLEPNRFDGNAGVFAGGIQIKNTLQLWGADLTGVSVLYRAPGLEVSGLAGFRYLNLSEGFGLLYESTGVSGLYTGQSGVAFDSFKTANHFYGATVGARAKYTFGPWSAELTGRVGIGASNEALSVNGGYYSINFQSVGFRSGPEGVFAQPANEGRFSSTRFAVVPEAQVKLGYDVTPWARISVGYDVLYDSNVIRPGDQISRFIPKGQTFQQGGPEVSTTSPVRLFRSSDFLAHGVSAELSMRF